jgi:hypothetical protein
VPVPPLAAKQNLLNQIGVRTKKPTVRGHQWLYTAGADKEINIKWKFDCQQPVIA